MDTAPRYYTVEEVAAITRISKPTLYRAINRGEIPVLRIAGTIRIPAEWLQAKNLAV